MNDCDMSHSMSAEDDFEFVARNSSDFSERDDLSSIASHSQGTDRDSDAGNEEDGYDSQTGSNITLQMPQVDRTEEFMDRASESMLRGSIADEHIAEDIIVNMPYLPENAEPFNIEPLETVELQIVFHGSRKYQESVLRRIAEVLLPEFTENVWTSNTFSFVRKDGRAEVQAHSRISFSIISEIDACKKISRPLMYLEVLEEDLPRPQAHLVASLQAEGVPILSLTATDNKLNTLKDGGLLSKLCRENDETTHRALTMAEFLEADTEVLSTSLMGCLDAWHNARYNPTWITRTVTQYKQLQLTPRSVLKYLGLLAIIACALISAVSTSTRIMPSSKSPVNQLRFHQITETNALIELPAQLRAGPAAKLPTLLARVNRDGKEVKSRLQLVVDNLYALDWAHSEAHGELVVIAQVLDKTIPMQDAYIIQYSAKTPFLTTLNDKLRDINALGQVAEADFSRRLNEIAKQLEESSSYAVNISQHHLQFIRNTGHEGLKIIQANYHRPLERVRHALQTGTHRSKKQYENVKSSIRMVQARLWPRVKSNHATLQSYSRSLFKTKPESQSKVQKKQQRKQQKARKQKR